MTAAFTSFSKHSECLRFVKGCDISSWNRCW